MHRGAIAALSGALLLLGGAALAQADESVGEQAEKSAEKVGEEASDFGQAIQSESKEVSGDLDKRAARMGMRSGEDETKNQVTTDPLGLVGGQGLNAQYSRSFNRRVSGVVGAEFGRLQAAGDAVTKFGGTLGADWYALGQWNEGLRIGPRIHVAGGTSTLDDLSFNSFAAGGELGYSWVSGGGLTLGAAGGLNYVAGAVEDSSPEDPVSGNDRVDPYVKANIGFSW